MAKKKSPATAPTLRNAVTKIQREGKLVVGRVEREVRGFVRRTRAELATDATVVRREVTTRAQKVFRDLDGRATALVRRLEQQFVAVERGVRAQLGGATSAEIAALKQQVGGITRRLQDLERRVAELTDQLREQLAPEQD